jgi:hypothetical protein
MIGDGGIHHGDAANIDDHGARVGAANGVEQLLHEYFFFLLSTISARLGKIVDKNWEKYLYRLLLLVKRARLYRRMSAAFDVKGAGGGSRTQPCASLGRAAGRRPRCP